VTRYWVDTLATVTPPAPVTHMRAKRAIGLVMMVLSFGCGSNGELGAIRGEMAPTGTLRAALNFGNPVLATKATADGQPGGVAVVLVRELARRLDMPVEFLPYDSAAAMAGDARTGAWDIAFLAADPGREDDIAFSPPYVELEATYLVRSDSAFRTITDIDADGVRVAARPRSAYDLFLRRNLVRAQLVYPDDGQSDIDLLEEGRADVLSGLRHVLVDTAETAAGWRVIDESFASMQQAIGVPQGRPAAAAYLRDFVEDVKATGVVKQAVDAAGAHGVAVAPPVAR
jgi:polar amino acid transport system substrate-binding protein